MPLTLEKHETETPRSRALCEQLPVRDYLDNVVVRTNGAFVAGYELKGLTSYFASDEGRDRGKLMLEALLRSLPEQSMRVQFRYEVVEDLGDLLEQYVAGQRSERARSLHSMSCASRDGERKRSPATTCGLSCTCISSGTRSFIIALPASR